MRLVLAVAPEDLGDLLGVGAMKVKVQLPHCGRLERGTLRPGHLAHHQRRDDPGPRRPLAPRLVHQEEGEPCHGESQDGAGGEPLTGARSFSLANWPHARPWADSHSRALAELAADVDAAIEPLPPEWLAVQAAPVRRGGL